MNEIKWGEVRARIIKVAMVPVVIVWFTIWLLFNEPMELILPLGVIALILFIGMAIGSVL